MFRLARKVVGVGLLAASATSLAQGADTIDVGVQVPLTGSLATEGQDMLNAVTLAKQKINKTGGINGRRLRLIVGDAACDPQQAVNAAHKLASKNVDAVVGGYCSGATLPTLQVYGKTNIPFVITGSNSPKLIPANPGSAFMINSSGVAQVKKAVNLFHQKKIESLAIVNQGDAYSQVLASASRKAWQKDGKKVPIYATVNRGQQDFSALVTKITSQNPGAVFWTAYYSQGALLTRQLRRNGYQGLIAIGDGSNSPKFFEIAGRAANGVYCFSNPITNILPNTGKFMKQYKKQFSRDAGPYSALTYDGLQLVAWAMNKAGSTDHQKVINALASVDGKSWLTGPISFTSKHTLARSNFVVLKGENGHWTLNQK